MQICDDSHLRLNFGRNCAPWNLNLHLVWTDHCSYCTCELLQQERKTQSTTLRIMEQESTDIFYVIIHDLNSMSLLGPDCTLPSFRWKWADRPSVHLRRKLLCFPVKLGGQSQTTRTLFDSYFYPPPSALQLAFVFSMTLCLHIFSPLNTFSPFGSHLCDHLRAEYLGFFSCFVSAIVAFMFACGDALIKRLTSARYDKGHLHFYISIS